MIFTPGQLVVLVIFTEIMIYALLSKCLDTIKHCSTCKTYRRALEKGMLTMNEFKGLIHKEVKKDENN